MKKHLQFSLFRYRWYRLRILPRNWTEQLRILWILLQPLLLRYHFMYQTKTEILSTNIREIKVCLRLLPKNFYGRSCFGNLREKLYFQNNFQLFRKSVWWDFERKSFVSSNGDPTLGSWRYEAYKPENFKKKLIEAIKKAGITKISGDLVIDDSYFDHQTIPGGWPWDDSGNYYGAGVWGINWRENQFDININGTDFKSFSYPLEGVKWLNDLKAGGSSDQSLIFTAPHSGVALINGMLPEENGNGFRFCPESSAAVGRRSKTMASRVRN